MIRFLNPIAFLALLLAVPILLLYFLRLRRPEVRVPSTLLWTAVLADRRANRPWQRLRWNWLLVLQLLALTTMVLALARPALPAPLALQDQVLVLLDASASMQTLTPSGLSRFEMGLRALRELADTLEPQDRVTLVLVGAVPRVALRDGGRQDLRRILADLQVTDGVADWTAAVKLSAGLVTAESVSTLLVTDAAFTHPLPALPGEVRFIDVGGEEANVGIVGLALRRRGPGIDAFVRLRNAGPATVRTLSLYTEGVLAEQRQVTLPEDGERALTFADLPSLRWAEARLTEEDALHLDNRAWVALSSERQGRVLLATSGNRFLNQALRALPGVAIEQSRSTAAATEAYDLIVTDGPLTTTLPSVAGLWLIAPGEGTPCGDLRGVFTPTGAVRGRWSHPLLDYVEWSEVHVAEARLYEPPPDADVLLQDSAGPLLWVRERQEQRIACLAFDLHDSDLPLRVAFPVLTANLVGWLVPETSTEPIYPLPAGRPWRPPLPPATTDVRIHPPDGEAFTLEPGRIVEVSRAGLYRLEIATPSGTFVRSVALALLEDGESDLRSHPLLVAGEEIVPRTESDRGWRELGRGFIIAALALVLLEAVFWWRPLLSPVVEGAPPDAHRLGRLLSRIRATVRYLADTLEVTPLLLRALLLLTLVLSALGVRWVRPTRNLATVFLLDRSASTRDTWEEARRWVEAALAAKAPEDRAGIVVFGGDAWVDRALTTDPVLASIASQPTVDATDIEEAVRLGAALIPAGAPGRLVLLTDGLETQGRAEQALREAQLEGVDLQLVLLGGGAAGPEIWIEDLRLPTQVYPGDVVPVAVTLGSNVAGSTLLSWTAGTEQGRQEVRIQASSETFIFTFTASEVGFLPLRVCLTPQRDTFPQNNCMEAWIVVRGAPRVLVVGAPTERGALVHALRQTGLAVEVEEPSTAPLSATGWAEYEAVFLVNTPARAYPPQSLESLEAFVRDLGGGLVAIGGPESYGVGGWLGTSLESVLPVEMLVEAPDRFPPLSMAVVIDKSGSMATEELGVSKIRLAAEAAVRVAESLNDTDTLLVVAFDDRPADTLGPVQMTQREELIAALLRLQAGGGGIYVRESLDYAVALLLDAGPPTGPQRHVLLLADGRDAEHQEGVLTRVASWREQGVSVSAVAIGEGPDVPFLMEMAEVGGGRFYLARRAADLPAIFAEETARVKRSYIVEEHFYPRPVTAWQPLADLPATPSLLGYVASTLKPAAQPIWSTEQEDPLLAVWQYGLGRSVAWTSDATGRWAEAWVTWEDFSRFWGSIARWVLPPPMNDDLMLRVESEGERARVTVDVEGDNLDLRLQVAQPEARVEVQEVLLHQSAPGRYEGDFALGDRNIYLLSLAGDRRLLTGWARPYSAEYRPGDSTAGGPALVAVEGVDVSTHPADAFTHDLRGWRRGQPLAPWLLLLALLLWPLDIAWRRLQLSWADWVRAWHFVKRRLLRVLPSSGSAEEVASPSLATRLRQGLPRQPESPRSSPTLSSDEPVAAPPAVVPEPSVPAVEQNEEAAAEETLAARLKRRLRE